MKRWKTIGLLLFVAVLAACNPREARRMEAALEEARAVYGDGSLEVEVDTVLFIPGLSEAPAYFAGRKQYHKAALAALLNGYTERDFDKEAAMASFKDAERYGERARDSLTVARAEYWMGKFLIETGRKEDALIKYKTADSHIGKHYSEKALIDNGIATAYILSNQLDSAMIYLENSLLYAQNGCLDKMKWKILNNYAVIYRIQGKYDQALNCLRSALGKPYIDDTKTAQVCLNMGKTFMALGELDSAAFYYQQLETVLQVANVKKETVVSAYEALLKFAKTQGNDSLALQYYDKHENALFDVMSQRQKQAVYRIQKQYDYEAMQKVLNGKLARNRLVIAVVVALLLSVLFFFLFRSVRASKREALANANLFHFMQQNKALVESSMEQEQKATNTAQLLSDTLYARIYAMQKLDYCLKTPVDKGALKDLEREVFGSGDHWNAVREILGELYPGLWESLKLKYPEMDEMELRVCMLSRLKLSRQGEATLLGISTSVLDKLRTKVRKTMEQDNNP